MIKFPVFFRLPEHRRFHYIQRFGKEDTKKRNGSFRNVHEEMLKYRQDKRKKEIRKFSVLIRIISISLALAIIYFIIRILPFFGRH